MGLPTTGFFLSWTHQFIIECEFLVTFLILFQEAHQKAGSPVESIAELAKNQKWWAVKYLCRRKKVTHSEAVQEYLGKNVIEWVRFYGEDTMVRELNYFLVSCNDAFQNVFSSVGTMLIYAIISVNIWWVVFLLGVGYFGSLMERFNQINIMTLYKNRH